MVGLLDTSWSLKNESKFTLRVYVMKGWLVYESAFYFWIISL